MVTLLEGRLFLQNQNATAQGRMHPVKFLSRERGRGSFQVWISSSEDIKIVAQLIEPKEELVTVDHLPGSKSWLSEASANLAWEYAVDIKNRLHHIKIHSLYLSTVQRSHWVRLITKAIDTTSNMSNSYQPLWLRFWRGDFFYKIRMRQLREGCTL